jgi:hypothetical protein
VSDSIQALVRADLEKREELGIERYGTSLRAHNGRDALRDAYEEALDLACYLKQAMVERDDWKAQCEAAERHRLDALIERNVTVTGLLDKLEAAESESASLRAVLDAASALVRQQDTGEGINRDFYDAFDAMRRAVLALPPAPTRTDQERAMFAAARDDLRAMFRRWHQPGGVNATGDAGAIERAIFALEAGAKGSGAPAGKVDVEGR